MQFSENSRVWVYQANRAFTNDEVQQLALILEHFTRTWTAHNHELKAAAEIRYQRFIILMVDEVQAGASGCSIDKSVRLMQEIEQHFNVNLFDRFNLAYRDGVEIKSANREEFEAMIQQGGITTDTIVFNNLVQTLHELDTRWEVPFKQSWHKQVFGSLISTSILR